MIKVERITQTDLSLSDHIERHTVFAVHSLTAELQRLLKGHVVTYLGTNIWNQKFGLKLWKGCSYRLPDSQDLRTKIVHGKIEELEFPELMEVILQLSKKYRSTGIYQNIKEIRVTISHIIQLFNDNFTANSYTSSSYHELVYRFIELLAKLEQNKETLRNFCRPLPTGDELTESLREFAVIITLDASGQSEEAVLKCKTFLQTYVALPYLTELVAKYWLCNLIKVSPIPRNELIRCCEMVLLFDRSCNRAHVELAQVYAKEKNQIFKYFHHYHSECATMRYIGCLFSFINYLKDNNLKSGFNTILQCIKQNVRVNFQNVLEPFNKAVLSGAQWSRHAQAFAIIFMVINDGTYSTENMPAEVAANFKRFLQFLINEADATPEPYKYDNPANLRALVHGHTTFLIGLLYEQGKFVKRDFVKSESYYQKSALFYNNILSCYHISGLYTDKQTCDKRLNSNFTLARQYLTQHKSNLTTWTTVSIVPILVLHLEFDLALRYLTQVNSASCGPKISNLSWLLNRVAIFKPCQLGLHLEELKLQIKSFEAAANLSIKGLTFLERLKRAELKGFKHDPTLITKIFYYMNIKSAPYQYTLGVDKDLNVNYETLSEKTYLTAPKRIFSTSTFRYNLNVTRSTPLRHQITYKTFDPDPNCSMKSTDIYDTFVSKYVSPMRNQLIVIEDLIFCNGNIHILTEEKTTGETIRIEINKEASILRLDSSFQLTRGAIVSLISEPEPRLTNISEKYLYVAKQTGPSIAILQIQQHICRFCSQDLLSNCGKKCECGFAYCNEVCRTNDKTYMNHRFLCTHPETVIHVTRS